MMSPGSSSSLAYNLWHSVLGVNPWMLCWRVSVADCQTVAGEIDPVRVVNDAIENCVKRHLWARSLAACSA
jgi:hypothetical protein